jgi:phospholipid/cholesterol/gamma-HCH transport system substrate-binding protein
VRRLERGMAPWKVGLLALLVALVVTAAAFYKQNPFADPFRVRAAFVTANDLKKGNPVRIAGIEVGKVESVEFPDEGTGAIVTMRIREKGLPLHRDATFKIRPRIFLEGNYFVDVKPGTPSSPALGDGDMVPATQTAGPVQFGQVLEALQTDTREDLRKVLQELGTAFEKGGSRAVNRTIPHWQPAYKWTSIVNDATRGESGRDLSGYIRGAGTVAEGLDRDPAALKALITNFAQTMQAFASEQENLSATIDELPRTLRAGFDAFGRLNRALPPLRELVGELRPTVRASGPTLDAQLPLVRQLRGLVGPDELRGLSRDLRGTVPSLASFARTSLPLGEQQRLLSSCQSNVIFPWQEDKIEDPQFPVTGKVYQEGVKWLPGIAGESRSFDANGQYVRSLAKPPNYAYPLGDGRFLFTGDPISGVNPPRQALPPFRPDVPCETQQTPDLRTRVQAPPRAIRIDNSSPEALARREKAMEPLRQFVRDAIERDGVDLTLSDTPLTPAELPKVISEVRRAQGR